MKVSALRADITTLAVDGIVNAANETLLGGGGVDGAIHRAAGGELLKACRSLGGCATGDAKITGGFNLPAAWVIHTVGPIWHGGDCGEEEALASCYRRSLDLAVEQGLASVAFPGISTGVYRFPPDRAAPIAVDTVRSYDYGNAGLMEVIFCCFSEAALALYDRLLAQAGSQGIP